ncbi:MAG TPA: oligosaccharide flippase family protein, partial [Candidatus Limnocylindrales bacterium]|nr:oligosaccharide flippase family protein [Candidatus Limnocylindrales bacterium]
MAENVMRLKGQARRGLATLALRYGVVIAINLLGTVVLSRFVGPAVWGVFAVAQVVYMGSQEILGRGAASYLIKKTEAPSSSDLKNAFAFQHLLGLLSLVVAAALAFPAARWYQEPSLAFLLVAAAIAAYGCAWRSIPVALLERELDYFKVAIIEVFEALVFSGIAIAFAWKGHALPGLAIATALRSILPTLLSYCFRQSRPALLYDRKAAAGMADFGFFILLGSIFNIAILFVPVIFVGKMVGSDALGEARMAFSLYGNLLFFTAAVLRLSFSSYSRLAEYPGEMQLALRQNLRLLAALLCPAVALFAGLAALWVPPIFGPKWPKLPL